MLRRPLLALAAILLAVALAACGGDQVSSSGSTQTQAQAAVSERIVSLSASATETLFAIGAGEQVVAVDDQSNYPPEAPKTKLSGYKPNLEAIAEYDPDLVIASYDPGGLVDGLRRLSIPVLVQDAPSDLEGAYEQMLELGDTTGHTEDAAALVARLRGDVQELVDRAAPGRGLSVYHELGPDYYSATSKTFIGSVYELLGVENIADEAGGSVPDYPQLSAEFVLDADPDIVVLSDTKCCGQTPETVAQRPGWKNATAVREGRVIPVDDDIASRWGPRIVEFVRQISNAMTAGSA